MLIDTMNDFEVNREVMKDWNVIIQTTLVRVVGEYNKERSKRKIPKEETYCKVYEFKTARKNNWMIFLSKPPSESKYNGDPTYCGITYYFTDRGLRVFKPAAKQGLVVYNGHFFQRYNERVGLGMEEPLMRVKHFFSYNGFATIKIIKRGERELAMGTVKDGLLLGELTMDRCWTIFKTFITRSLARENQLDLENDLINSLQLQIEEELNKASFSPTEYSFRADVMKGILSGV
jgi:hypothetical protein